MMSTLATKCFRTHLLLIQQKCIIFLLAAEFFFITMVSVFFFSSLTELPTMVQEKLNWKGERGQSFSGDYQNLPAARLIQVLKFNLISCSVLPLSSWSKVHLSNEHHNVLLNFNILLSRKELFHSMLPRPFMSATRKNPSRFVGSVVLGPLLRHCWLDHDNWEMFYSW